VGLAILGHFMILGIVAMGVGRLRRIFGSSPRS
jgi:hypothetical protein